MDDAEPDRSIIMPIGNGIILLLYSSSRWLDDAAAVKAALEKSQIIILQSVSTVTWTFQFVDETTSRLFSKLSNIF